MEGFCLHNPQHIFFLLFPILHRLRHSQFPVPFRLFDPEIEIFASLELLPSREKTSIPLSIIAAEKKENIELLFIELNLPDLQPGRYSMEFTAREKRTKLESIVTQILEVK